MSTSANIVGYVSDANSPTRWDPSADGNGERTNYASATAVEEGAHSSQHAVEMSEKPKTNSPTQANNAEHHGVPHDAREEADADKNNGTGLVIYVAPKCPFCMRVKGLFTAYNVHPTLIDTTLPENVEAYAALAAKHEHYTVPLVLFNGRLIGGCDDVCALIERGELPRLLDLPTNHAQPDPTVPRRDIVPPCLFSFPPLVDNRVVRMTGLLTMVISIILIVFRKEEWAWWVSLGMAVDFVIRFMYAGTGSALGSLALAFVAPMDEELVPGPPKQFAAFVGVCFYSAIAAVFIGGDGRYGSEIAASILLGIIAFFAFLESFFNFCAGCFVFGYLVAFGIVRNTIYQPYTDSYEYTNYAVTEWNAKNGWVDAKEEAGEGLAEPGEEAALSTQSIGWRRKWLVDDKFRPAHKPVVKQVKVSEAHHHGAAQTTVVDIHYKFPKTEETSREKWSYKYISFADFASCMGTAGFALMSKNASKTFYLQDAFWIFFGLFAATHFALFLLALIAKTITHPKKVFMEFQNPMKRNASAMIPIVFCILSLVVRDDSHNLALVLFWIGGPFVVANLVIQMAYLVRNRHGMAVFAPTVLVAPLGLFVVSINISALSHNMDHANTAAWALEAAKFFWGAALLFYMALFACSMYAAVLFHWGPDKMRPAIVIWMGAAFITASSYVMIFKPPTFDAFAFVFFSGGLVLYLAILYLIFPGNWLLRGRFDMANWGASFPLSVFGVAATTYYSYQRHPFAQALCWIGFASSGFANFLCLCHTVRLFAQRKWPGPHPECSPLMFNKFVSDSLVELSARLKAEAKVTASGDEPTTPNANARIVSLAEYYLGCLKTVVQYNVDILLPEFAGVNSRQTKVSREHHEWSLGQIVSLQGMVASGDAAGLRAALPAFIDTQYDYFMWMQDHLGPLMMKGMTTRIGMVILERVWEQVPKEELQEVVSMTFRYASKQMYRTMFLKTVTSALPERCQQIGRWLFIDAVRDPLGDIKLSLLFDDMPEIIPKGIGITWTKQM